MKKFLVFSFVTVLLSACGNQIISEQAEPTGSKVLVATSFYPLTFIVEHVGKDLADVYQISAQGADPHTYEPTPQQIRRVYDADLLVFNGQGQDPWAERIRQDLAEGGTRVLVATELVALMGLEEEQEEEHDDHGEWDPHVWLDPVLVGQIAQAVSKELSQLDPDNAAVYAASTASFVEELHQLDRELQAALSDCALDSIVVSHGAFRYLAHRYNFETLEIAGLSPSAEPSPARLAELSEVAEERGITHIFFETHVSPALSRTLADEIGAQTLVLHSVEALTQAEQAAGKNYFDLMRLNLQNLRTALHCS